MNEDFENGIFHTRLKMADGANVSTLEELREHFDLISLLEHYSSGKLLSLLYERHPDEAESVAVLEESMDDFEKTLCSILNVPFELNEAVECFRKAAESGNAEGQFRLGCYYMFGIGVEENEPLGVEWIRKSAEQGHVAAQYELGVDYMEGHGVDIDEQEAVKWIRAAAENGHVNAQTNMGVFCYIGMGGIEPDNEEAIRWFEMAADSGDIDAVYWLGGMYFSSDDEKSYKYYREAAEYGHPGAMRWIAYFYMNGISVEKDKEEAVNWLRMAAKFGDGEAAEALEQMDL